MIINAELLLQYQRCKRRSFLDVHGDYQQRDIPHELLVKMQQDKITHRESVLEHLIYDQPDYPPRNWEMGAAATIRLMQQGVNMIYRGVLLATYEDKYTLLSRPDLLVKQPGKSSLGDWLYVPVDIQLGKRPKQEYQVVAAFHAEIAGALQEVMLAECWLVLRSKETTYAVDLYKWRPQMLDILADYVQVMSSSEAPEVFIARQKCNLCHWYNHCYSIAREQQHLSLLPGVTPVRYNYLRSKSINSLDLLAKTQPSSLENVTGFDYKIAWKLVIQAQSTLRQTALILPETVVRGNLISNVGIELYFDIEAQPDLNLNYLLGVLVVDIENKQETFYSFLATKPEEEELIWQQFVDLVCQYPHSPIYHFCNYEVETVNKLGKLYGTPDSITRMILTRFVDIYEQLIETVALPIESYALKAIANWLGFTWRDPKANGAKCIYWYDQWLETGDREFLKMIQVYNEDDCYATRRVKDWLVTFTKDFLL
ncbi:TM0106 family RecB-like putative nuclease [Cylindrospermopsis raciborskii]|uniref:TM0106 family RecB-like putative nuclease n=1 Tax=Cylindrospermopsis raciborskii TaxID=77022 RepID=UPI000778E0C7|nr:TM0106 family RecB-like putative nuclease [Cylindrospermopsis raciborskii]MCZ2202000.1 TM0106 family RecB-like putative nuclease [Cylindrospermopsis raciborskii PAMP2012]MCZ2205224.1 TM0106 family RecB-like putative nuclease [Cylindrospermopsis raciborskii PAMP2011]